MGGSGVVWEGLGLFCPVIGSRYDTLRSVALCIELEAGRFDRPRPVVFQWVNYLSASFYGADYCYCLCDKARGFMGRTRGGLLGCG